MSRATLHCGDVRAVLAALPAESVQMVCTSPPFWGLRDYGVVGQLGLERTPEEYVAIMVAVFREVRRVLRSDGCVWLNLGDSYVAHKPRSHAVHTATNGKQQSAAFNGAQQAADLRGKHEVLKDKDLVGIPWRTAFALQADGWWLRSDVIWAKPNPMPESVTDRPTRSHEYLFLLTKSERYWYDAQAIAEPSVDLPGTHRGGSLFRAATKGPGDPFVSAQNHGGGIESLLSTGQRNARSVWTIATAPFAGAHFACFPEELARRCILAGSSPRACEHCGAPWSRMTEREKHPERDMEAQRLASRLRTGRTDGHVAGPEGMVDAVRTIGWHPTCECPNAGTGSCVVLDPFGGSGTVPQVATGNGRDSIYIDLNPKYLELARQRIGPMFCGEVA